MRLHIEIGPSQIKVRGPYNPSMVVTMRVRGGKWLPSLHTWVMPNTPSVMCLLESQYGLSQEQVPVRTIVRHPLMRQQQGVLSIGGYPLARWEAPGLPVTLCEGVGVFRGEGLLACGSRSRPVIRARVDTELVYRVARDFAERNRLIIVDEEVES